MTAGGVVELAVIAHHAAEHRVHRQTQRFAADIPERQVDGAERVHLLASGRVEERAQHILPEVLDAARVLADHAAGALHQQVGSAAFADAGDAGVGLDGDNHIALIEERVGIRRRPHADAGHLHLGDGGDGRRGNGGGGGRRGQGGAEKRSAVHVRPLYAGSGFRGVRRNQLQYTAMSKRSWLVDVPPGIRNGLPRDSIAAA